MRALVNAQSDMEVVAEADNSETALAKSIELKPDILSLDLTMPGGESVKVIERLRCESPATRVIVLTMHNDAAYCRATLAVGAWGYVIKTAADTDFITAIRAVHRGNRYVDRELQDAITQPLLSRSSDGGGQTAAWNVVALSRREREVLALLAQGYTNQAVANQLSLSVKTVESYRARLMVKLGFETRADLVRYALETGLLAGDVPDAPPPPR